MLKLSRVLAPAALVLAFAAPVHASPATVGDAAGDSTATAGDVVKIRVTHGRKTVKLTWQGIDGGGFPEGVYWQIDTNRRDAGPEFRIGLTYDHPATFMTRVDDWGYGWAGDPGTSHRCRGDRAIWATEGVGMTMRIPRNCLAVNGRAPQRVRAHVDTTDLSSLEPIDSAPNGRTFSPWVKVG